MSDRDSDSLSAGVVGLAGTVVTEFLASLLLGAFVGKRLGIP